MHTCNEALFLQSREQCSHHVHSLVHHDDISRHTGNETVGHRWVPSASPAKTPLPHQPAFCITMVEAPAALQHTLTTLFYQICNHTSALRVDGRFLKP